MEIYVRKTNIDLLSVPSQFILTIHHDYCLEYIVFVFWWLKQGRKWYNFVFFSNGKYVFKAQFVGEIKQLVWLMLPTKQIIISENRIWPKIFAKYILNRSNAGGRLFVIKMILKSGKIIIFN